MQTVIIKYNAGNIQSVDFALRRLGVEALLTDDPEQIRKADKVIFPGVGEASTAMRYLTERKLDVVIRDLKQPVLGICIGLQLLCTYSEENNTNCIGVFNERIVKFQAPVGEKFKIPQMGWNTISQLRSDIFTPELENQYVYFVHSYCATVGEHTSAVTTYTQPFSAALHKNNFYATQFHPEKSGTVGARILKNFLDL